MNFIGIKSHYLEEVGSTNTYLLEKEKENPLFHGELVYSFNQTHGRGQRGNSWNANAGENLFLTFILKSGLPKPEYIFELNQWISVALVELLTQLGIENVNLKWPNDIFIHDKKVAGILIENSIQDGRLKYGIVGIGLNINQHEFDKSLMQATSLSLAKNSTFDLEDVKDKLIGMLNLLNLQWKNEPSKIKKKYLYFLKGFEKQSSFFWVDKNLEITGKIIGVDEFGRLKIDIDGSIEYFTHGQIKYII